MPNIKQRYIKPGRDFNYSEGVKVLADTAVYADQIVYVTSSSGPFLKVATADADGGLTATGRLMIAKHDIAAGSYGIVLPWKLVTTVATTGQTVGDPIYLADAPGTAVGSNLVRACPTGDAVAIVDGRITVVGAAGTGAILVNASAPEERVQGGETSHGSALISGSPTEQFVLALGNDGATRTFSVAYPIIVTDVMAVCHGTTDITSVKVYNGAVTGTDYIALISTNITATDGVGRAETMRDGTVAVAAEGTISIVRDGGQSTDRIIITAIRG